MCSRQLPALCKQGRPLCRSHGTGTPARRGQHHAMPPDHARVLGHSTIASPSTAIRIRAWGGCWHHGRRGALGLVRRRRAGFGRGFGGLALRLPRPHTPPPPVRQPPPGSRGSCGCDAGRESFASCSHPLSAFSRVSTGSWVFVFFFPSFPSRAESRSASPDGSQPQSSQGRERPARLSRPAAPAEPARPHVTSFVPKLRG